MQDLKAMVQRDLDRLKDAFLDLDRIQRLTAELVSDYARLLPDRARSSSLVPRHTQLETRAHGLVEEYLNLVTQYEDVEALRPPRLQEAGSSYHRLAEQLEQAAGDLERFLDGAQSELSKVGDLKSSYASTQAQAVAALDRAHAAWQHLRDVDGLESPDADLAFARARVAARAAQAWTPQQPITVLEDAVRLTVENADACVEAAQAFPAQVTRLRTRASSLRTRLAGVEHRTETREENMAALRREFAYGNWDDIQLTLQDDPVAGARDAIARLEQAVVVEDWAAASQARDDAESELRKAEALVDAPRRRLEELRMFRADPEARASRARFALRDAQLLVTSGDPARLRTFGPQLDAQLARIDTALAGLVGRNPDFRACLRDLDAVEEAVAGIVARYRSAR
ncbi:hypothetical protein [Nocardioides yefusunii]|nr:hypothetical protein [Nocardioides yefusunii]